MANQCHSGAAHGVLTYEIKGDTFTGSFSATKLADGDYKLIYYRDTMARSRFCLNSKRNFFRRISYYKWNQYKYRKTYTS